MCQICWVDEELLASEVRLFYGINSDFYTSNENVQSMVIMSFSLLSDFLAIYECNSHMLVQEKKHMNHSESTANRVSLLLYVAACSFISLQV
jgi:hypothetical protein